MAEISISRVMKQTGLTASALRYYEEIGLVSPTGRIAGRRQYDESVLTRLALIQTGQQAGFTLAELRILLRNVLDSEAGGAEWFELLDRKVKEMEMRLRHIEGMKSLLEGIMDCDAANLAECIMLTGQQHKV